MLSTFRFHRDQELNRRHLDCGCDAIKFQSFNSNSRVSSKVKSANYAEKADGLREDINEMFKSIGSVIVIESCVIHPRESVIVHV